MKDITKREDLLALCGEIDVKSKSRFVPVMLLLVGIIIVVLAFVVKELDNLSTALLTVGFVLAVVGVVKCVRPGERLVYRPTGEVIGLRKLNHELEFKPNIECAIVDGNIEGIITLRADGSAPLMSVCWSTPSGSLFVGQLLQYIPYEYKPQMEPVLIKR